MGLLTVNEAAEILKVSPLTVRRYIAKGKLHALRSGRLIRIRREELERLFDHDNRAFPELDASSDWESTSADDPLWRIVGVGASEKTAGEVDEHDVHPEGPLAINKQPTSPENGVERKWRPTSNDDSIWRIADLVDDDGPTDASANIHEYIADAIEDWRR